MKLGIMGSEANRSRFFEAVGADKVASAEICHGRSAPRANLADAGKIIARADGLVTSARNLFLSVTVADCFPVYFFDAPSQTVGLAHAGWRGIAAGIITGIIKTMAVDPKNILCGIGPGIRQDHFEIKGDVAAVFGGYSDNISNRQGKIFLDLPEVITKQLLAAGLQSANIEAAEECTYCEAGKYFSYRRDHPEQMQAMAAYIGLTG